MDAALETLTRALDQLAVIDQRMLLLGARPHPLFDSRAQLTGWQPFKPLADAWDAAGFHRSDAMPGGTWPVVACLPGKSKEEILHTFALAYERLEPGGLLVASLPNSSGASRFEKLFAQATGHVDSISKHKCRAFWATKDGTWNESLFAEWTALGKPTTIPDTSLITVPGVFSAGRLDEGSQFLTTHLPRDLRGTIADLGAGWGYLSDNALRQCQGIHHIDLYEADFRALECARQNLAAHAGRARFHWHDVTKGISGGYDAILMNPPFHTGQVHDTALGLAFLTTAARALRQGGRLFLVANRQLPYESHLDSLGLRWRKMAENHTYKLLFATA